MRTGLKPTMKLCGFGGNKNDFDGFPSLGQTVTKCLESMAKLRSMERCNVE